MGESTIRIHAERVIDADVATVWRALEGTVWQWSSFMLGLGQRVAGDKSTLRLRGVPGGIPIVVDLLAVDHEREIRWSGGIPRVFVGEHYIRLHAEGESTRVEHGELYSGFLGTRLVGLFLAALTRMYARDIEGLASATRRHASGDPRSIESGASGPGLPESEAALTPAWLGAALAEMHPHARVKELRLAKASRAGDGLASTADRLALEVRYHDGADDALPAHMLLKTILLGKGMRVGPGAIRWLGASLDGLGRLPGGGAARGAIYRGLTRFQERFPQAPDAMYENEVRFYRDIRPGLEIETPAIYASIRDPRTRRFGLLMEDLGQRRARFPTALDELTTNDLRALLSTLATLHARFWQSPELDNALAWVPTSTSGGMFEVFDGLGLELIRAQLELYPFKQEIIAPLGHTLDAMWNATWSAQRTMAAAPQTLLHGDPHIGNTYLLPDGTGGLLDWQLMMRGCFVHDVAYVIASGLPTEVRRRDERALLAHYLDALAAHGITSAPSLDATFELYRRAVSWGLVIGWLITPPQNYGVELTSANVRRLAAAASDLGTFEPAS